MSPEEWRTLRVVYAGTYPVRPLIDQCDRLVEALAEARRVMVAACGTQAPFIRAALQRLDAAAMEVRR